MLNFEEEIRKVNIFPTQVPEDKELINGSIWKNGEKIKLKDLSLRDKQMVLQMNQLTEVIKDLIGKNLTF